MHQIAKPQMRKTEDKVTIGLKRISPMRGIRNFIQMLWSSDF
jgi:hypothetical protein